MHENHERNIEIKSPSVPPLAKGGQGGRSAAGGVDVRAFRDLSWLPSFIRKSRGFTLIEIIMAIVIIGIVVSGLMVSFNSGLKNLKNPEYVVEAAFLGQKEMEGIAVATSANLPVAATYSCTGFSNALVGAGSSPYPYVDDCNNANYTYTFKVEQTSSSAPFTAGSGTDFTKVTLTVHRIDNAISDLTFYTLYGL